MNLIGEMRAYPQRGTLYAITLYDNNGHATERREYNEAQVLTLQSVFTHVQYGNQLSWTVFKADGTTVEMSNRMVQCDAKGNVIRFAELNHDGSVGRTARISYDFDDHGNWTRKEIDWAPQGGQDGRGDTREDDNVPLRSTSLLCKGGACGNASQQYLKPQSAYSDAMNLSLHDASCNL